MLTRKGVTAWRRALAGLTPAGPGAAAPAVPPPGTRPAPAAGLPAPVAAELINVLAAVALAAACRPRNPSSEGDPDAPRTAASKVTAAHLSRTALLYVRQSSLKQVIHNTESAIRQYDLRGKAIALGWAADQITVIDIDQGQSGASAADREGFQRWSPRCRWAGPGSCSAWNAPGWPATPPTGTSSSSYAAWPAP